MRFILVISTKKRTHIIRNKSEKFEGKRKLQVITTAILIDMLKFISYKDLKECLHVAKNHNSN